LTLRFSILSRSHAFIELRANIFGQPVTVIDEPELTAIGAALIAAQGAGVALPFGEGLNLQQIQPVASWVEPYTRLYQDYRARLDAASEKAMNSTRSRQ
jgi:xylulokinase